MTIDDLALASGFSEKDLARYRPMLERMVALALAEKDIAKPDANAWHWGDQDITAYRLIKR